MTMELLELEERGPPAVFGEKERTAENYKGIERRAQHRRVREDRRGELRFELDKPDRRVTPGRRASDSKLKFR